MRTSFESELDATENTPIDALRALMGVVPEARRVQPFEKPIPNPCVLIAHPTLKGSLVVADAMKAIREAGVRVRDNYSEWVSPDSLTLMQDE